MQLQVLKKEGNAVTLLVKGSSNVEINTLRRLIVDYVPTLALEEITFRKNSSAMFDEYIALRLGLNVVNTDLKSYNLPEECKCEGKGCQSCQLFFTLKAKGPKTVYAEELKSKDPKIKSVYGKTPIIKLLKKQEIDIEAKAVMGQGKDHMKFSPGHVYYQGVPIIKAGKVKNAEAVAATCPVDILEAKDSTIKVTDNLKCILCNACVEASQGEVEVKPSNEDFLLTIEPFGQLKVREMLSKALEILDDKLDELEKGLKNV